MSQTTPPTSTRQERLAWCFYDFADSAFPTVIITAVYVLYFKNVVMQGRSPGTSDYYWGAANSLGALIVFALAPFLGAMADVAGKKRFFLVFFTLLCVLSTLGLALTGPGTIALAIVLFVAALVGFEAAIVFYDAFLPDLVPENHMGRLSGNGWALGYIGGLLCLIVALLMVDNYLREIPLLVGLWYGLFAIPSLLLLKDRSSTATAYSPSGLALLRHGALRLWDTVTHISAHRPFARFLLAYFFYNNAVMTIIVFATAFSSDSLHFTLRENILLVVAMNVIAAPGAFFFGKIADAVGAKRSLVATLILWLVVVAAALVSVWPDIWTVGQAKGIFWGVAALASLGIGAVQATSRSFVGQLAPAGHSTEFYGFMAFAGKGSAVLGPLVFGLASKFSGSQAVAVATIGVFFALGLVFLLRVTYKPAV